MTTCDTIFNNTGFDVNILHIPITATLEQFLAIVDAQVPVPIPSLQVSQLTNPIYC